MINFYKWCKEKPFAVVEIRSFLFSVFLQEEKKEKTQVLGALKCCSKQSSTSLMYFPSNYNLEKTLNTWGLFYNVGVFIHLLIMTLL